MAEHITYLPIGTSAHLSQSSDTRHRQGPECAPPHVVVRVVLVTLFDFICLCDSFVFCLSNCITGPKFLSLVILAFNS